MKTWQEEKGWPKTRLTQEMIDDWTPFVEIVEKHMRDEINQNPSAPDDVWQRHIGHEPAEEYTVSPVVFDPRRDCMYCREPREMDDQRPGETLRGWIDRNIIREANERLG